MNKIKVIEAKSFKERLFGLIGKKNIDYCLLFNHCNSIHTFFMKEKIDIVMTDKNNKIIYIKKSLKKNRIILPKRHVYKTYEFPNNYIKDIKKGDILKIK